MELSTTVEQIQSSKANATETFQRQQIVNNFNNERIYQNYGNILRNVLHIITKSQNVPASKTDLHRLFRG